MPKLPYRLYVSELIKLVSLNENSLTSFATIVKNYCHV